MAVKNGSFQIIGDQTTKVPGSRNSIVPSPSANPPSGEFQKIGTEEGMARNSITSPSANPPSGNFQKIGTEMSLNRQPVNNAWGSAYQTPMSREVDWSHANTATGHRGRRKHHGKSY